VYVHPQIVTKYLIQVECLVVSLSVLVISSGILYMLAGFLIVAVVTVFCCFIAALMPVRRVRKL